MPEFKIFKIIFKCLNCKCRQASPIRKYFYKTSRESAVQIPCLLRYKTKPLEEEPKKFFFEWCFILRSFKPSVWSEVAINYSEVFVKCEVKSAAKLWQNKLHCKSISLPHGNCACPSGQAQFRQSAVHYIKYCIKWLCPSRPPGYCKTCILIL